MKKLILVVLALCLMSSVAYALEPKVSYFWEADNSQFVKLLGTSVEENIVGIKGLDIDLWYLLTPPSMEIKYDEITTNNLVMPGISYSKEVKGFDIGINIAAGLDRIETVTNIDRIGEFKYGIGICLGKKF
ncbi:exported hypothetical protein [Azospirillaceae bacterium]